MKRIVIVFWGILLFAKSLLAQQTGIITSASGWVKTVRQVAPVITWQSPQLTRSEQKVPTVRITACIQSVEPLSYHFFQNGKEIPNKRTGFKHVECGQELTEEITLEPGANEIHLTATNPAGTTTSDSRYVTYKMGPQTPPSPNAPKRLALVVANASYPKAALRNPINDGRTIRDYLQKVGFEVVLRENLPLRELKRTVDTFLVDLGRQKQNVGLVFYAGHGLMVNGDNYLQPVDADPSTEPDVEFECYPLRRLVAKMEQANPTGANLVFWDACRNNPYRSWNRSMGDPIHTTIAPPVGTMIVYATEPGKVASDGLEKNGLFTSELIRHIEEPGVDIYGLIERIDAGLEERGIKQPPYSEGRLRGKFYFVKPE
ncbi:caspase family protein [Spirosoma endbachense]|uniref:Caspase family p20 domain-containing protein n=1 Tax=Spirosoma endbachense TaxID=2666025 RepID=A0A6P1VQE4_9BACT|nr:caspase family protein [Spirosoma endbachense]QHV94915.1 hypothetical protein GJR95_07735 [Spirosoma endbachense]